MGRHVFEDLDFSRLFIHLDFHTVSTVSVGLGEISLKFPVQVFVVRIIEGLGHDHGPVLLVMSTTQNFREGNLLFWFLDGINHPLFDREVLGIRVQLDLVLVPLLVFPPIHKSRSDIEDPLLDPPGSQDRGVSRHERGPACVSAHIPGTNVRIPVKDVHIFTKDSHLLGNHLGDDRVRALTHVRGSGEHVHSAEVIHLHNGAATIGLVDSRATAHMDKGGHADAPSLNFRPLLLVCPVEPLGHFLDALLETARRYLETLRGDLARLIGIAHPELQGIDP